MAHETPACCVGIRVRREQILMRPRRDADRPRVADVRVHGLQRHVVVQNHDAAVAAVADVDVALRVDGDRVRRVELIRPVALARRQLRDEPAVLVVLHDARVDVAVGDEDVALRVPGDVGRASEAVLLVQHRRVLGVLVVRAPATAPACGRAPSPRVLRG